MVSAKTASCGRKMRAKVFRPDDWKNFFQDVAFELYLACNTPTSGSVFCIPTLGIDGVYAEELRLPAIQLRGDGMHHPPIFKLVKAPAGGGKDHDRDPGVAEDQHLHLTVQSSGLPLVIFPVHGVVASRS